MVGSPTRARGNVANPVAIITVHEVPEAVKRGSSPAVSAKRHDRGAIPLVVKLYPELSIAALKAHLDKELALWYELRAINVTGSGRLVLNDALATLVSSFGYSRSTAYRLLRAGDGRFWELGTSYSFRPGTGPGWHSVIEIYALSRVAERFSTYVHRLSQPVQVPVREFRGRKAKRAWLYSSFFKPAGTKAKPIARDSIMDATGVERRQQQRYDKVAGIKRVANFACRQDAQGNLVPIRHLVAGKSRVWEKDRRLGNTYHSAALTTHRGMTKRVNARLRRSLLKGEARLQKRFFLSAKSLVRSAHRAEESFLRVKARDRVIVGRVEWCIA
ncbi:hypothetical protein ES703_37455 [subsurface metagenome]